MLAYVGPFSFAAVFVVSSEQIKPAGKRGHVIVIVHTVFVCHLNASNEISLSLK
jgi:hypothetical protein